MIRFGSLLWEQKTASARGSQTTTKSGFETCPNESLNNQPSLPRLPVPGNLFLPITSNRDAVPKTCRRFTILFFETLALAQVPSVVPDFLMRILTITRGDHAVD
jgi:hypothetical protein